MMIWWWCAYPRRDSPGWVDLGGWFCTEVVYHPGTNSARRTATTTSRRPRPVYYHWAKLPIIVIVIVNCLVITALIQMLSCWHGQPCKCLHCCRLLLLRLHEVTHRHYVLGLSASLSVTKIVNIFLRSVPTLMQTGTSGPCGKHIKQSTVGSGGQRSRSHEAEDRGL